VNDLGNCSVRWKPVAEKELLMTETNDQLREMVRDKYADIAKKADSGCGTSCCEPRARSEDDYNMIGDAYEGVGGYMADADLGLGCGVPVEHAGLRSGQTVLDLVTMLNSGLGKSSTCPSFLTASMLSSQTVSSTWCRTSGAPSQKSSGC
jgi:hypothetical protein